VGAADCHLTNLAHKNFGFLDKYFDMLKASAGCLSPAIAFPQIRKLLLFEVNYGDRKIPQKALEKAGFCSTYRNICPKNAKMDA
jgi:hypothetical protein